MRSSLGLLSLAAALWSLIARIGPGGAGERRTISVSRETLIDKRPANTFVKGKDGRCLVETESG